MGVEKDRAVVIHSLKLGEADRIVTFCTPSFGKVRAVARGIRRAKSRLTGAIELFNVGELVFFLKPNRDLHNVNTFDVTAPFGGQLRDPLAFAYASYFAELAREFSLERDENPPLFDLFVDALACVATVVDSDSLRSLARAFELRLLGLSGYRPRLDSCVVCSAPISSNEAAFGLSVGGTLCPKHAGDDRTLALEASALEVARAFAAMPLRDAVTWRLSRRQAAELRRLLTILIAQRVEKPLRGLDYAEMLEVESA